jgi:hypothetical protein
VATVAAADIATAGMSSVTVFNPSPGGGTSNALPFEIVEAGPAPWPYRIYLPFLPRHPERRFRIYLPFAPNKEGLK